MGEGVAGQSPPPRPVRGRAPTARERGLRAIAEELTPLQALATIDEVSARLLAAVSLTATLAGAVGLLSASTLANIGIGWAIPCVAAAGTSVALAVCATLPSHARLAPGELDSLEAWFERQIGRRLLLIRAAASLLVVSVLAAVLPSVVSVLSDSEQSIAVGAVSSGAGVLRIEASADGLSSAATLQVLLTDGTRRLAFARTTPRGGRAAVDFTVCALPGSTVRLVARALGDGANLTRGVSVTIPSSGPGRPRCPALRSPPVLPRTK